MEKEADPLRQPGLVPAATVVVHVPRIGFVVAICRLGAYARCESARA